MKRLTLAALLWHVQSSGAKGRPSVDSGRTSKETWHLPNRSTEDSNDFDSDYKEPVDNDYETLPEGTVSCHVSRYGPRYDHVVARYGPRSFRVAAPKIWNMLPTHLKNSSVSREQFKSGLKTWVFVQAYS